MFVLSSLFIVALWQGPGPAVPPPPAPVPPVPIPASRPLAEFAGTWKYNELLSVNAATGRPESARAANERRGISAGPGAGISGGGGAGNRRGTGGTRPGGGGGASAIDGAMSLFIAQRDTRRDLLEIAPELKLAVSDKTVTVTDDLNRTLVFPFDSTRQKYQYGAAQFDARTTWAGSQLKTDIEGPDGLKMFQTWFLSEDGSKLFLIIRVGEAVATARPVGVNRVYDRIPQP
jgi:hypothetical protein